MSRLLQSAALAVVLGIGLVLGLVAGRMSVPSYEEGRHDELSRTTAARRKAEQLESTMPDEWKRRQIELKKELSDRVGPRH